MNRRQNAEVGIRNGEMEMEKYKIGDVEMRSE
jgi:hypothetical protein